MKLSDVVFKTEDCCGHHEAATVTLDDGRVVGLRRSEDVYSITYYDVDGGKIGSEDHVDATRVEEVLA